MSTEPPIKSVATAFQVIEFVKERNGARLTEVATAFDLPRSTASDYLTTLHRNQYLVKRGHEYQVGLRFLELGDRARHYRNVYDVGRPKVDSLAQETGELVHLSVEENGLGVIIHETEGASAVSLDTYVGRRVEMHCTALGKAMLSCMPEERVEEILDEYGLPEVTQHTITDRAELLDHLSEVRERGYATSDGERIAELGCIAAPIKDDGSETVFGAVSVCLPMTRMEDSESATELPMAVRQMANRIELDLLYK